MSIRNKITLLVVGALLVTTVLVVALGSVSATRIIERQHREYYDNRVGHLTNTLETTYKELVATGMREIYEDQAKANVVKTLSEAEYGDDVVKGKSADYPFVLDSLGDVVMHPVLRAGEKSLSGLDFVKTALSIKNGDLKYVIDGERRWMRFRTFAPWGWLVGVTVPTSVMYHDEGVVRTSLLVTMLLITILISVVLSFVLARVLRPLSAVANQMRDIAQGEADLTRRLGLASGDEVGEVGRWFDSFTANLQAMVKKITANARDVAQASERLALESRNASAGADKTAQGTSVVARAAQDVSSTVVGISKSAEIMSSRVSRVAKAIQEISATLSDVASRCVTESQVAARAHDEAGAAHAMMTQLGEATHEIGRVVDVISDIADQTNLLALNATIEAASAGDAGKGFAVVAAEVKELARQTARATAEITQQITNTQHVSTQSVAAIQKIAEVIEQVNTISQAIASSVEEQSTAIAQIVTDVNEASGSASEIAQRVQKSSMGLGDMSGSIQQADQGTQEANRSYHKVSETAADVKRLAEELLAMVSRFKA